MLAYLVSQIYADISLNQLMAYHAHRGNTLLICDTKARCQLLSDVPHNAHVTGEIFL